MILYMDPEPTTVARPLKLRIADDIRMRIEAGELKPGDPIPTIDELAKQWSCSPNAARAAKDLLVTQGLITSGRGTPAMVIIPPPVTIRSNERHQAEKDMVLRPEEERAKTGVAETDLGLKWADLEWTPSYDTIPATAELAKIFDLPEGVTLLRRRGDSKDRRSGEVRVSGTSYIPYDIVSPNPALLDVNNEPWPGGTQHQLYTVGIELGRILDEVSARVPTTVEQNAWGLENGVVMIEIRRVSYDTTGRAVEVSDSLFPGDRTHLHFYTDLKKW
jgi:GntR family transcriptional regulator